MHNVNDRDYKCLLTITNDCRVDLKNLTLYNRNDLRMWRTKKNQKTSVNKKIEYLIKIVNIYIENTA
jgi:hypothetical protein